MRRSLLVGSFLLGAAANAPIIPEDMTLVVSYQYPVADQDLVLAINKEKRINEDQPAFKDKDGDGLISVAKFINRKGHAHYEQIEESRYADMGKANGKAHNPTKREFVSVFETVMVPAKADAAIAYDNSTKGQATGTSLTFAFTTSGSDRFIVVGGFTDGSNADNISSITYNSVTLSRQSTLPWSGGNNRMYLYYLAGPASGANNVVCNTGISINTSCYVASYTGVAQTSPVDDSEIVDSFGSTVASITAPFTTTADNEWGFTFGVNQNTTLVTGSNTTLRQSNSDVIVIGDSNAAFTPPGSFNMTWDTNGGNGRLGLLGITFKPSTGAGFAPWQWGDF